MTELHVTAEHDGSVAPGDVRSALSDLDVSSSSPIDSEGRQAGVQTTTETDGDGEETDVVVVSVVGHEGDWTKKSEGAVTDAIKNLDGVDATTVEVEGGYTSDE